MTTPPVDGQLNWGDPLNSYLTNFLQVLAQNASTSINSHTSNIPADPHGDRAYTLGLVSPITTNTNKANGYVVLNSSGKIPTNLYSAAGGSFTDIFDVVAGYGAVANGSTDASGAIQNALNDCANGGGGEVWVPSGTYALANPLVIGANTWLHLANGAVMLRIAGTSTPPRMLSNAAFNSSSTVPAAGNIKVSGGTWNTNVGAACTPFFFVQASFVSLTEFQIIGVPNNPAIELNGCTDVIMNSFILTGPGASGPTVPAIRLNTTDTTTTPAGLPAGVYNDSNCNNITIRDGGLVRATGQTSMTYGALAGTDLTVSAQTHNNIVVISCFTTNNTSQGPLLPANWTGFISAFNQFASLPSNAVYTDNQYHLFSGIGSNGSPVTTDMKLFGNLYYASGGSPKVEPSVENWHVVPGSAFGNGWNNAGSPNAKLSYRRVASPANCVQIIGVLNWATNGNTIFQFPTTYRPASVQRIPNDQLGYFQIDQSGNLTMDSAHAQALNLNPAAVALNGFYSLDV